MTRFVLLLQLRSSQLWPRERVSLQFTILSSYAEGRVNYYKKSLFPFVAILSSLAIVRRSLRSWVGWNTCQWGPIYERHRWWMITYIDVLGSILKINIMLGFSSHEMFELWQIHLNLWKSLKISLEDHDKFACWCRIDHCIEFKIIACFVIVLVFMRELHRWWWGLIGQDQLYNLHKAYKWWLTGAGVIISHFFRIIHYTSN